MAARIRFFKIKNRRGYAAICGNYLTEGATKVLTRRRMEKALRRGTTRR